MATQEAIRTAQTCEGVTPIFTNRGCCPIHPTYPGTAQPVHFPNVCAISGGVVLLIFLLLLLR